MAVRPETEPRPEGNFGFYETLAVNLAGGSDADFDFDDFDDLAGFDGGSCPGPDL
jgi:hypothetical protein